jgi:hypothetical protein
MRVVAEIQPDVGALRAISFVFSEREENQLTAIDMRKSVSCDAPTAV